MPALDLSEKVIFPSETFTSMRSLALALVPPERVMVSLESFSRMAAARSSTLSNLSVFSSKLTETLLLP